MLAPFAAILMMLLVAATSRTCQHHQNAAEPRSDLATAVLFSDGSIMGHYYRENRIR